MHSGYAVPLAGRARVGGVVAFDDEMLIELLWEQRQDHERRSTTWMFGPTSSASIITLSRWRDARAVVAVRETPGRVVLQSATALVNLRAMHQPDAA